MGWVEGGVLEFSEMEGTQNGVCFWNMGGLNPSTNYVLSWFYTTY